jgi:DNA-binding transcriptional LysR family regulator
METPLPPMNAIRCFEVVVRHLNFSQAAQVLGVTPSAVSKQISILEDFIGAKVFERSPTGLVLTLEGRALNETVSPAFDLSRQSFQRFSRRPPRSQILRLATVASFAQQFLIPRLSKFEEKFSDAKLEILTSDRTVEFSREEIDIGIRYGTGQWESLISKQLVPGELIPVCLPTLFTNQDVEHLVSTKRRIQIFAQNEWLYWSKLNETMTFDPHNTFVMEHFMVAAKAVLAGEGIALLPNIIIQEYISNGDMVQFSEALSWHQTFYYVHRQKTQYLPKIHQIAAWLLEKCSDYLTESM